MSDKPTILEGRAWLIADGNGKLIADIDTDMIYHNNWLAVTDIAEMGQYTFGNLPGWEDFPQKAEPGDIVICGGNFGAGSSRQHAVDCFRALGVQLIVAESFGAIYKRNAINSGMPILTVPVIANSGIKTCDVVTADLVNGMLKTTSGEIEGEGWSRGQMDVYNAGDLFEYGKILV
ncbi:MAG: 3-isopropylmalate dehydratase [bacterium]|nr:3-isopropylmalate dehydratase [bacterium]